MGDFMVVLGIGLIGLAFVLFLLEMMIPASGLIGMAAATSLVIGLVCLFRVDTRLGLVSAIFVVVMLPVLLGIGLKYWPESPIAQILTRENADRGQHAEQGIAGADAAASRAHLIGKNGTALTDLKPGGFCRIEGQRIECLSDGGFITAGSTVRVIAVDGMQTKVREIV